MLQLTQNLKDGAMQILEVPYPALSAGTLLVRNHFSVISAGTEGKTVRDARLGYVAKARARKKEVVQVLDAVRTNGLVTTYRKVKERLEAPAALGYSCAGEVIAVGEGVSGFRVGDLVACGGVSASHAEVVAVPKHLCTLVPEGVDLRHAAFTTLAAIAMQGVRQAELGLGSNAVVIGLGLVGVLTVELLHAAGVRVVGIDVASQPVALARRVGASLALQRGEAGLEEAILDFTRGAGADAVLITAGTSSLDPVELAGRISRRKGKVVIVGSVPTGFSREAYYRKELDLRMSCSYGPGRYDTRYEEKGIDYPIGYVRWTENRNMQAYLDLLAAGRLDLDPLISHTFSLDRAPEAYQMILERSAPFTGILIAYDHQKPVTRRVELGAAAPAKAAANIGFIGAGSFAQNMILPALGKDAQLVGVATGRPNNARNIAQRYGFRYCTGEADEIVADGNIDTVFVLTRHDLHAPYVLKSIQNGKHVFVEKPLCMNLAQLDEIRAAYERAKVHVMVGFNRRFAPHVQQLRAFLPPHAPRAINYRINAGILPADHWVHDPETGGGRIVGEVCHFVDLALYLAGAPLVHVAARALQDPLGLTDTVTVSLDFENGSTASISYFSNGHKELRKEYLEVFSGGRVAVLDDFQELTLYGDKTTKHRLRRQDKGHGEEVARFLQAVRGGGPTPIPFAEIEQSMRATFGILESIQTNQMVAV